MEKGTAIWLLSGRRSRAHTLPAGPAALDRGSTALLNPATPFAVSATDKEAQRSPPSLCNITCVRRGPQSTEGLTVEKCV